VHGIELINNNSVVQHWLDYVLTQKLDIMEVGVSRDYGSSSHLVQLLSQYSVLLKLIDPNSDTLKAVEASMGQSDKKNSIFYYPVPGEDLELKEFKNIGFAHLDGYDIITRHKHKESTIQAYASIGHNLLLEGNVRSSISHFLICKKLVSENIDSPMLIILDDTWLEKGVWMGKGATAIPFLIANGYALITNPSATGINRLRKYAWGVAFIRP
jgi:hypothetical protein